MYSDTTYSTPGRFYAEPSNQNASSLKLAETNLYKTEYCRNWTELGDCRYGKKCKYAHGESELRKISRHNQYKTKICRAYHFEGTCLYGRRCTFIHDSTIQGSTGLPPFTCGYSDSQKVRQRSRFFASNNNDQDPPTTLNTELQTKKIWDSKLGLDIYNKKTLDDQSYHQIPYPSVLSSSSYYSSSFSSSASSSSSSCIGTQHIPGGIISTLDPMTDDSMPKEHETNQQSTLMNTNKSVYCLPGFDAYSGNPSSFYIS